MADYVRRGKVEFELCGGNLPEKYKAFVRRVLNDKNLVPAADVAEVVRCKDCKHRTESGNCGHPRHHGILPSAYPYDFYNYGERRGGGDDNVSD